MNTPIPGAVGLKGNNLAVKLRST